jgi:hypothetical protein
MRRSLLLSIAGAGSAICILAAVLLRSGLLLLLIMSLALAIVVDRTTQERKFLYGLLVGWAYGLAYVATFLVVMLVLGATGPKGVMSACPYAIVVTLIFGLLTGSLTALVAWCRTSLRMTRIGIE